MISVNRVSTRPTPQPLNVPEPVQRAARGVDASALQLSKLRPLAHGDRPQTGQESGSHVGVDVARSVARDADCRVARTSWAPATGMAGCGGRGRGLRGSSAVPATVTGVSAGHAVPRMGKL